MCFEELKDYLKEQGLEDELADSLFKEAFDEYETQKREIEQEGKREKIAQNLMKGKYDFYIFYYSLYPLMMLQMHLESTFLLVNLILIQWRFLYARLTNAIIMEWRKKF